ncbi:hypothetical protein EJ05DRAFT_518577 [Pseudovirgaria hyperparasitica]|uniref:Myb-like domain-containing protein n=1 Tax=Pseudovirgaria hyperparasitica TaxID=470096 RepID=A0A6A6VZA4_9PEZI|nr:uncharacterized protein EJ05DRAFT_518577 [Pseudovirgaria hyperparasitica]KAF2755982.1 hypothetical protein EJ05DRAFT_518577 [Pseudovirgaria hyperparasitica]
MDQIQWTQPPSDLPSIVDSPLSHDSRWPCDIANSSQNTQPGPWNECYYPVPLSSADITASSQLACSSSVSLDPTFAQSNIFNTMSSNMAQYPYIRGQESPTPTTSDQDSSYQEHLQSMTSQPHFTPSHARRHNSYPEFDHASTFSSSRSNPFPSGASATSLSGHGSEEEGGTTKEQEERLLLELKDEQNQSWKKIADIFRSQCNKDYSVPALQMRYRRLRQRRLLDFNDADQAALMAAYDYWETKRWEIISEKMAEFGATDSWTPKACSAAWLRLKNREHSMNSQGQLNTQLPDIWRPMDVLN